MKTKCLIADDDDLAAKLLADYVNKSDDCEVVAMCENGLEVKTFLASNKVDILFLDIQMPYLSGIELLEQLNDKPAVIITTSYSDYALDGFRLDVIDYLLKPFPIDRFQHALNKAKEFVAFKNHRNHVHEQSPKTNFIFVKSDYKMVKISFDDILYVEGWKQYLKIFTPGKCIITLESLKAIEALLPSNGFIRIHKSFLVSIQHIHSSNRSSVKIGEKWLPIGQVFKEKLFLILNDRFKGL